MGETRDDDPGVAFVDKPPRDLPGWWLPAFDKKGEPRAGHVVVADIMLGSAFVGSQISNILAIDVIRAEDTWFDLVRQSLIRLQNRGVEAQGEIERGTTAGIEPGATDRGSLS